MSDGADDRDMTRLDSPGYDFLIERPKIFQ